ncbi:MAG: hypothetical protein GY730_07175 [bacterium]|nr:hypothetical protein [bacterium]
MDNVFWVKVMFSRRFTAITGVSIIELSISLLFISILLFTVFPLAPVIKQKIQCTYFANNLYHMMSYARTFSLAKDMDSIILSDNDTVQIIADNKAVISNNVPAALELTINNRGKLGFTSRGTTKYSGTVRVKNKDTEKKVTLAVGHGKLSIK